MPRHSHRIVAIADASQPPPSSACPTDRTGLSFAITASPLVWDRA
jgi:hypothetical protein